MALELADLGRDRPPYTTELVRAAEVCDSGSDLSEPQVGKHQPVGPMGGRGRYRRDSGVTTVDRGRRLNRSAIVDEKLTDSLTVFVNVAIEQAHVAMPDAVLEQVIRTSLIAQLSPKVLPLLLVYVVLVHAKSRNKDGLALIVGIDVRVRQRGHFVHALRQLVTDAVDGTLNVNRHSLILFLRCSFSITRDY